MIVKNLKRNSMKKHVDKIGWSIDWKEIFNLDSTLIFNILKIDRWLKKDRGLLQGVMQRYDGKYSEKQISVALCMLFYLRDNHPIFRSEIGNEISDIYLDMMLERIEILDNDVLKENPYFKNVKIPNVKGKRFSYEHNYFMPNELQMVDEDSHYNGMFSDVAELTHGTVGISEKRYDFPCIMENRNCWMSITENEIRTMQKAIDEANGKVCTLGLGLGYFAYMAHLKDNVEEIVIIDKEEEVIEMFKKHILPQFEHPEKIKIVQSDAYDYLESLTGNEFNFLFADIWASGADGIYHYLKLRDYERKFKEMTFSYWIENTILYYIQDYIYKTIVQREEHAVLNLDFMSGCSAGTALKKKLESLTIESPEDFENLKSLDFIKSLI